MFYTGQKVVYIGGVPNPLFKAPKIGEIVTLSSPCDVFPNHWDLLEYPRGYDGELQSIHEKRLAPLLTDSIEFAEQLLEEITIEINQENLVEK